MNRVKTRTMNIWPIFSSRESFFRVLRAQRSPSWPGAACEGRRKSPALRELLRTDVFKIRTSKPRSQHLLLMAQPYQTRGKSVCKPGFHQKLLCDLCLCQGDNVPSTRASFRVFEGAYMNKLRIVFLLGVALVFSSFALAMESDYSHHTRHHHKHKKHRHPGDWDERRI